MTRKQLPKAINRTGDNVHAFAGSIVPDEVAPEPAPRPARRKPVLNQPDHADAQIARIRPRHAVPQQHLWVHSRSIHHIWESPSRKISNLPSWKPL